MRFLYVFHKLPRIVIAWEAEIIIFLCVFFLFLFCASSRLHFTLPRTFACFFSSVELILEYGYKTDGQYFAVNITNMLIKWISFEWNHLRHDFFSRRFNPLAGLQGKFLKWFFYKKFWINRLNFIILLIWYCPCST